MNGHSVGGRGKKQTHKYKYYCSTNYNLSLKLTKLTNPNSWVLTLSQTHTSVFLFFSPTLVQRELHTYKLRIKQETNQIKSTVRLPNLIFN